MQQINNHLALVQASAKSATPIKHERMHVKPWNDSTETLVLLLFTRLADLFNDKAKKTHAIYKDREKKIYSTAFELWCRKLNDLSTEDFKRGMAGLEKKAEDDYREGNEMWPPSYAEFRALAFPKHGRDTQAHKLAPSLYDPQTGTYRLEDQTAKARRYETGLKNTSALLAMLSEPSPEKFESETELTYGQEQLAKAKTMLESGQ